MIGRTVFPECTEPAPAIEPGIVVAGRYVLLRRRPNESRPRWLARENQRNLLFSLQLMRPASGEAAREPFERELDEVSQLVHPKLVRVLDYGWDEGGLLFAAEERVEATSLAELLEVETFTAERAVEIVAQVLEILHAVHEAGLVHGDLGPSQVLVRRAVGDEVEEVLLRGLGCARFLPYRVTQPDTRKGIAAEWVVGNPEYASPEQLCGQPHDARSDLYAVGVLLFRLLAGRAPFEAQQALDVAWLQRFTLPPPPSNYVALSPELESVCLKALSKTPELRYQTAGEMQAAVRAADPRLRAAAEAHARARLRARRATARSRMPTLPMQIPASAVGAIEMRDSSAPRHSARDASVWIALGLLSCTLAAVAIVTASRLGLLDESDETGVAAAEVAAAESAFPEFSEFADAREAPAPSAPSRLETLSTLPASPTSPTLPTSPSATPSMPQISLAATAVEPLSAESALSTQSLALAAPPKAPMATPRAESTAVAQRVAPRAVAAARVAHAPPPKPTRAPVPAKLVPKAAQVDAKAREIKPQPPSPPEPPPRVAEIDAPAGADPAPAGAGVDPATPAGAETAEAAVAPQQAPPPPPAPIPASTAAPTTAPPAPQPIFPAPVGSGSEPALPVTLSRSAQAEGGTVHVVLGRTDIDRGAVSTGSLREALNIPALERCYASSPAFGGSQRLQVALEITTELSGRISSAKVGGQLPAKFAHCIEEVVRFGRVRDADTGALHATIDLYFQRIGGR